ncbi:ankyrin repeat and SOCS box protein 1 isoform X1 [Nomascus leucogenys]|uniref:ankyrin repeat and SOCS box protein 1 isoform X1 n=1 Tax=Nomascus leucogenys TaxID=61853 RepID=UPI00122D667E|nr:ankyrin repeat and SOCS box protein 1 isoform X1 [Nomascus leucogenys]
MEGIWGSIHLKPQHAATLSPAVGPHQSPRLRIHPPGAARGQWGYPRGSSQPGRGPDPARHGPLGPAHIWQKPRPVRGGGDGPPDRNSQAAASGNTLSDSLASYVRKPQRGRHPESRLLAKFSPDEGTSQHPAGQRGRKWERGPCAAPETSEAGARPPEAATPTRPLTLGAGSGRRPFCFLLEGRARVWGGRGGRSIHGGGRQPRRAGRAGLRSAGRNLKEWLREQFCDHPLEHCEDTRLHDAAYVGDLQTLRSLLQEESYRRYGADVDVNHHLTPDVQPRFSRRLTSLVVCPLYISAAYHNLQCFRLLLLAGANPDFNCNGPVNTQGFYRGSPGCVMDAVLRHGCEAAFVSLLVEFGANLNLVKWESLGPESRGRRKVDPEALQVFKEARSVPRTLLCLCRVAVRRALGKYRLHLIPSLPLPDPIKKFLLHE